MKVCSSAIICLYEWFSTGGEEKQKFFTIQQLVVFDHATQPRLNQ
jgi:hypothetical protein